MVTEKDLILGGEYTIQYADDVLWSCSSETHNFINQCNLNKFNNKKK